MHGRILDVGCGSKPYQELFGATEYIGLEIEGSVSKDADYLYAGKVFPFNDEDFDSVFSSQTLEHVF